MLKLPSMSQPLSAAAAQVSGQDVGGASQPSLLELPAHERPDLGIDEKRRLRRLEKSRKKSGIRDLEGLMGGFKVKKSKKSK